MKGRMPWIYLLLTFTFLLILNLYLSKEGFYVFGEDDFSKYLLSLITFDPDDKTLYGRKQSDLSGCPVPPKPTPPPAPTPAPTPPPTCTQLPTCTPPPNSNTLSESTATSLISYLKADIDENIRNQKLQERLDKDKITASACPRTDALEQGKQSINCQRVNTQIDMSEYIRKDSIPCWGCSF
jgi:hypothetical protein